jgi:hypothetical protein
MTLGISATFCVYLHSTNVVGDKSVGSQSTQKALLPSGGFISGFITATAVYVVFSSLMIYYVARRLTRVKSGFAHNPAYIKVGHEVRSGE